LFDLSVAEGLDIDARFLARLEAQMTRMLLAAGASEDCEQELEVSMRLCSDNEIHALNRDYRHMDRPTDVLAFSQREGEDEVFCPEVLGDIVISIDTAKRQAKSDLYSEIIHLAAHGLCHLLGYDHQDDEQEAVMNRQVTRLIAQSA